MLQIKIPKKHYPNLLKILQLKESSFKTFIKTVSEIPPKVYPEEILLEAISKIKLEATSKAKLETSKEQPNIVQTLLSLLVNRGVSEEETTNYVEILISEDLIKALKIDKKEVEVLKKRLISIFNVEPLIISAKATNVLFEYYSTFGRARVLTDIRPVFSAGKDTTPKAAMIVHSLNIHYHQESLHKEFYVELDDNDIQELIDNLRRAQSKSKKLKKVLDKSGLNCLNPF